MNCIVKIVSLCLLFLALLFSFGCRKDLNSLSRSESATSSQVASIESSSLDEDAFYSSLKEDLENPDSNYGEDWFPSEHSSTDEYKDFPIFDPNNYEYSSPEYNDSYTDYNPLEGYSSISPMPEISETSLSEWNGVNPFSATY